MCIQPTTRRPSPSLTSFHLFPQLPTEIRLAIYAFSLPTPRLVPVNYQSQTYSGGLPPALRSQWGCTSPSPIPALLHVCQEARALALEHYHLSFQLCGPPGIFPAKVWFRKDGQDVMYVGPREGLDSTVESFKHFVNLVTIVDRRELRKVRKLAVHEGLFLEIERGGRKSRHRNRREDDGVPDLCLREFWECVRERFTNVEEVMFLRNGTENHVITSMSSRLIEEEGSWAELSNSRTLEESLKDFSISAETLTFKILRAATTTEMEMGWTPPNWRVLGREGTSTSNARDSVHVDVEVDLEAIQLDEKMTECCTISKTDMLFQNLYRERSLWS